MPYLRSSRILLHEYKVRLEYFKPSWTRPGACSLKETGIFRGSFITLWSETTVAEPRRHGLTVGRVRAVVDRFLLGAENYNTLRVQPKDEEAPQ